MNTITPFVRAYLQTVLFAETGHPYGECPCCGRVAVLDKLPEPEHEQTPMCGNPGCGVKDANPEPLDQFYSLENFAPATLGKVSADCERFQAENRDTIQEAIDTGKVKCGPDFDEWGRAAIDFHFTRSGHGVGFWDGDWPEPMAEKLTQAAKAFGNLDYYIGDNGLIYCS